MSRRKGRGVERRGSHFIGLATVCRRAKFERELSFYNFITISTQSNKNWMIPANINPLWNYLYLFSPNQQIYPPFYTNFSEQRLPEFTNPLLSSPPSPLGQLPTPPAHRNLSPPQRQSRGSPTEEGSIGKRKSKKEFRKDKNCPAEGCKRKYSSRIALRAHIRKQHPRWEQETSDYEP